MAQPGTDRQADAAPGTDATSSPGAAPTPDRTFAAEAASTSEGRPAAGAPSTADATRAAIAHHTRALRTGQGLSVRALAEAAGISPALVSQLENAQANPTIEVLSSLADALGTTLAELALVPSTAPVILRAPEKGGKEDLEGRTLLPSASGRRTEMYEMFLAPGTSQQSAPHGAGSEEVAYVVAGSVQVSTEAFSVTLRVGDAVRFGAEDEHAYVAGGRGARLVTAVSMPTL